MSSVVLQQKQQARLKSNYPWTQSPLIVNGPMGPLISPQLAAEVTRAGGLGFLGCGYTLAGVEDRLEETRSILASSEASKSTSNGMMPVGLGVLCFQIEVAPFVGLVQQYRPIAVWLFAANDDADYISWAAEIRKAAPGTQIWIQTNSVADAVKLSQSVKADILVLQGTDAGGHGPVKGAGIISLIPEAADALSQAGFGDIPLIAAGGIADGRGAAAAMALGASGVTLGTRFLASDEVNMPGKDYQKALLATRDGGQSTVRSQVFDDVSSDRGSVWPKHYDGRALRNLVSAEEEVDGVRGSEARKRFEKDSSWKPDDLQQSRATGWAGTGVGLVNSVEKSERIVRDTREDALKVLNALRAI